MLKEFILTIAHAAVPWPTLPSRSLYIYETIALCTELQQHGMTLLKKRVKAE